MHYGRFDLVTASICRLEKFTHIILNLKVGYLYANKGREEFHKQSQAGTRIFVLKYTLDHRCSKNMKK